MAQMNADGIPTEYTKEKGKVARESARRIANLIHHKGTEDTEELIFPRITRICADEAVGN